MWIETVDGKFANSEHIIYFEKIGDVFMGIGQFARFHITPVDDADIPNLIHALTQTAMDVLYQKQIEHMKARWAQNREES